MLLEDIGLETVMKINRPAQAGEKLTVSVNYVDVVKGIFKFEEISTGTSDLAHEDDELSDESEASDVSVGATYS